MADSLNHLAHFMLASKLDTLLTSGRVTRLIEARMLNIGCIGGIGGIWGLVIEYHILDFGEIFNDDLSGCGGSSV